MLNVYCSHRHYADHLAPVWLALPADQRGLWVSGSSAAHKRTVELGIRPHGKLMRSLPAPRKLETSGPWLVASYADLRSVGHTRRAIVLEHGAGQHYHDVAATRLGQRGASENVILYLGPNDDAADRAAEVYPNARCFPVGCPKLDAWHGEEGRPGQRTVALSFHFDAEMVPEARSALGHYVHHLDDLHDTIRFDLAGTLIGHGHPRYWHHLSGVWDDHDIEPVQHFDEVVARADLYVCDNSSTLFEFAALDRPVVVLNAPWYRRDVEHGLRFWSSADVGVQVDDPSGLACALAESLEVDPQRERRREITRAIYGDLDGLASKRAATAILEVL